MEEIIEEKTLIEQAREAAIELRAANAEKRALLEREERMRANDMLGGRAEAGIPTPKPVEETPKEYAARVMKNKL